MYIYTGLPVYICIYQLLSDNRAIWKHVENVQTTNSDYMRSGMSTPTSRSPTARPHTSRPPFLDPPILDPPLLDTPLVDPHFLTPFVSLSLSLPMLRGLYICRPIFIGLYRRERPI